jgi:hypothetical protein
MARIVLCSGRVGASGHGGGGDVASVAELRAQALEVAGGWSAAGAPASWQLTAALFRVIAAHEDLLARLAGVPPGRLPTLLASAAVSFLVRRDRPVPLAGYFPAAGAPQPPLDAGFYLAATSFISDRLDDIAAECARHRYQMNEVARCTQVALGLAAAAGPGPDPVALVDLGTGAGLGLQLDRYRYLVGGQPSGPAAAALALSCEARGRLEPPPAILPPIAERAGIDVAPVDLEDPAARAWLEACAPPEAGALARLAAAVEVTRQHPVPLLSGDVVGLLPGVLRSFPPGRRVMVVDAYLAVFLSPGQRAHLAAILAEAGRSRPVTWLSLDPLVPLGPSGRDSVQGLPLPRWLVHDYATHGVFAVLGALTFDGGASRGRLLARAHPSGQWVEWLDPASAGASPAAEHPGRHRAADGSGESGLRCFAGAGAGAGAGASASASASASARGRGRGRGRLLGRHRQPGTLGLGERDGLPAAAVPADRDGARLGRDLLGRRQDRLPGGQARAAQPLRLDPDQHPAVRVADLRAEVDLQPGHHIVGVTAQGLDEEGVPALLEVAEEHGMVDVTKGVGVPPPDLDRVLERRAHIRAPSLWPT